ncbi:MAG: hypothetical protein F4222_12290 [Gammaproteobacteria bacterium]|nr:hypothetical protein [Gammaproteobacteria bacterium]MYF59828.1 hypothetical protein [Gammaproteobacteria bacterium]
MGSAYKPFSEAELERGRAMFLRIFGPDYGAELCEQLEQNDFNRQLMTRIAPEVWDQEVVDLKTMILCAIGIVTAARHDVGYFVRAGIHHGISREEMEAVIMLAGLEAGFPSAGEARRRLDEAYASHQTMLDRLDADS